MKQLLVLALLVLAGCNACVKVTPNVTPEPILYPIALFSKYGAAHACPVNGHIVTAAHVAYSELYTPEGLKYIPQHYVWDDGYGHNGIADPFIQNNYLDMAIMVIEPSEGVVFYPAALSLPVAGETVTWIEYDFRSAGRAYDVRQRRARVLHSRLFHFILDEAPTPGASGTCLFNTAGEVVGIITAGQTMQDGTTVGVAVDITNPPPREN